MAADFLGRPGGGTDRDLLGLIAPLQDEDLVALLVHAGGEAGGPAGGARFGQHQLAQGDGGFLLDDAGGLLLTAGLLMLLDHVHALDKRRALAGLDGEHPAAGALVLAGDHQHLIVAFDSQSHCCTFPFPPIRLT
jgi:hypothetical protein